MSAVIEPFADRPGSVSKQLQPWLLAVELVCKQYSISEDSGVAFELQQHQQQLLESLPEGRSTEQQQQQDASAPSAPALDAQGRPQVNLLAAPGASAAPHITFTKATGSVSPLPRHDSEGRGPLPDPATMRPFLSSLGPVIAAGAGKSSGAVGASAGPSSAGSARTGSSGGSPLARVGAQEAVVMMSPGAVDIDEEEEAWRAVARTLKPVADTLRTGEQAGIQRLLSDLFERTAN